MTGLSILCIFCLFKTKSKKFNIFYVIGNFYSKLLLNINRVLDYDALFSVSNSTIFTLLPVCRKIQLSGLFGKLWGQRHDSKRRVLWEVR